MTLYSCLDFRPIHRSCLVPGPGCLVPDMPHLSSTSVIQKVRASIYGAKLHCNQQTSLFLVCVSRNIVLSTANVPSFASCKQIVMDTGSYFLCFIGFSWMQQRSVPFEDCIVSARSFCSLYRFSWMQQCQFPLKIVLFLLVVSVPFIDFHGCSILLIVSVLTKRSWEQHHSYFLFLYRFSWMQHCYCSQFLFPQYWFSFRRLGRFSCSYTFYSLRRSSWLQP